MTEENSKCYHWDSTMINLFPYCYDNEQSEDIEHIVAKAYATLLAKICVDTQANVFWKGHKYPSADSKRPNGHVLKAYSMTQSKSEISIHPLGYVEVTYNDKKDMSTYLKKFNMMYMSTNGANKVVISEDDFNPDDIVGNCELVSYGKTKLFHKLVDVFSKAFTKVLDENPGKFTFATAHFYKKSDIKSKIVMEI